MQGSRSGIQGGHRRASKPRPDTYHGSLGRLRICCCSCRPLPCPAATSANQNAAAATLEPVRTCGWRARRGSRPTQASRGQGRRMRCAHGHGAGRPAGLPGRWSPQSHPGSAAGGKRGQQEGRLGGAAPAVQNSRQAKSGTLFGGHKGPPGVSTGAALAGLGLSLPQA